MTDNKQPEALRLAEQYDYGDPAAHSNMWKAAVCNALRRQHARIAELEAELEAVGAGGVQALSAAPAVPNGDELRRIARSARTSASDDASPTEYVLAGWKAAMLAASPTPPAEQQAPSAAAADTVVLEAALRAIHQSIDLIGEPDTDRLRLVRRVLRGAVVVAEDSKAPQPEQPATTEAVTPKAGATTGAALGAEQATPKAAPVEQFDSEGFRAWVRQNLPDDTIIGSSEWWADHLTTWAQRFAKAAPQQEAQEPIALLVRKNSWRAGQWEAAPPDSPHYGLTWANQRQYVYAAPQPAPAPLSDDVARDAARYRWLRNESWAGYHSGDGTPKVFTLDGAGNRRVQLAEEAMDSAIDAALAAQEGKA